MQPLHGADVLVWVARSGNRARPSLTSLREDASARPRGFHVVVYSIHDRAKRAETCHIRDGTWLTDDIAKESGLDLAADTFAKELWLTTHQSFTLSEGIAKWKFGPHSVKCRTPLSNIRLTTFFAAEHEVRIVDPDRVQFIECVGCQLRELSPDDSASTSANAREQT